MGLLVLKAPGKQDLMMHCGFEENDDDRSEIEIQVSDEMGKLVFNRALSNKEVENIMKFFQNSD